MLILEKVSRMFDLKEAIAFFCALYRSALYLIWSLHFSCSAVMIRESSLSTYSTRESSLFPFILISSFSSSFFSSSSSFSSYWKVISSYLLTIKDKPLFVTKLPYATYSVSLINLSCCRNASFKQVGIDSLGLISYRPVFIDSSWISCISCTLGLKSGRMVGNTAFLDCALSI